METAEELLTEINLVNDLARTDMLLHLQNEIIKEEKKVDVTGYWRGYDTRGRGLVEYRGKIYTCTVLARRVKQNGAKVNLRRTSAGNFANWD